MKLPRRRFLHLAASAAALPAVSRNASAQTYPSRPVHLISGYAAGGPNDIVARLMSQWLSEHLGQPFIIVSSPGGGSNTAAEAVARATPDGYTLYCSSSPNAISATLYDNLNFNFIRDIAPVASISFNPLVMEVNPSVPAKTVPQFIAYAKANSGKLSMASNGNLSTSQLAGELFKMMTGVSMANVPYRGAAPALTDLMGGQMQVMFDILPSSIEHIRAGELRALAVTTAMRSEALPDVPSLSDFLPGYEAISWNGLGAPKNTPAEIVTRLNREINAGLADPKMKARFAELGAMVLAGSPADFGELIAEQTEKWAKVIRAVNIKPD
jgi:tripartite-type tricarboxylate transporter receptor subunit TctC